MPHWRNYCAHSKKVEKSCFHEIKDENDNAPVSLWHTGGTAAWKEPSQGCHSPANLWTANNIVGILAVGDDKVTTMMHVMTIWWHWWQYDDNDDNDDNMMTLMTKMIDISSNDENVMTTWKWQTGLSSPVTVLVSLVSKYLVNIWFENICLVFNNFSKSGNC